MSKIFKNESVIMPKPYVGEDGIYVPVEQPYIPGEPPVYMLLMSKELFVEAYNKFIKQNN